MIDPFTANYFVAAVLPWVLLLVLAVGIRFGRTTERADWVGVVLEASCQRGGYRFERVRDHAIKVSGAAAAPMPWPPPLPPPAA